MSGLYIHIPYCHSKCAYCDFLSTPRVDTMSQYVDALIKEFDMRVPEIQGTFSTIYIGGGTPSILPTILLNKIITHISKYVNIRSLDEFTIEANPEDISSEWCDAIVKMGVSRVSMGIQSFNDVELKAINRRHSAQMAVDAIDILRRSGINEISGDLIYGLPGQSLDSWKQSLEKLLSFGLPHFSAYLLSYEPGTGLYAQLKNGKVQEASEELAQEMYNHLIDTAKINGYEHYEISNFSLPGHKAIHNSNYWRDLPYLGLGVSAHSFDGCNRRFNGNNIKQYITSIESGKPYYTIEDETQEERHNDYIIVSLRTSTGINLDDYRHRWGETFYEQLISTAQKYLSGGEMIYRGNQLAISEKSMLISDRIMIDFII